MLLEVLALRVSMTQPVRFLLVTGFLGGFTTFSAFSLESVLMIQRGAYADLCAYIAASVLGTIALVFIGSIVAKPFV
jgi:CrcB protein